MRRTTICRSERAALLALVAGLLAGLAPALAAQDTTQARPDTSTPAPDTSQAAPAPAPLGQLPATHTVTTGETLWSIAQLYYSDPLLWPEIYRLNTSLIDDPHWIYPGEELSLAAGVSVSQAPESASVAPAQTPRDTVPAVPRLTDRSSATTFDQISIQPPRRASYHVGDSLLVVRIDRDITGWGGVVVPVGVARVTELQRRQVLADVIMQFGRIHDGHLALPLEPFKDPGEVSPPPVDGGLEGVVIAERDLHVLAGPQQIVFINRGRAEGVNSGDVFEGFRPAAGVPGTSSEQMQVVLQIVHTRDHSASGLILNVGHPKLVPGMAVRLIRKMPS